MDRGSANVTVLSDDFLGMNTTTAIALVTAIVLVGIAIMVMRYHAVRVNHGGRQEMADTNGLSDPVFGECRFNGIDAYDCSRVVATPHSPATQLAAHIWLYDDGPTDLQKAVFADLISRYEQLWPNVASELVALHPELSTVAEVEQSLRNRVAVHIGEHAEDSLELVYEFALPNEGIRGFFLRVDGTQVTGAFIAE